MAHCVIDADEPRCLHRVDSLALGRITLTARTKSFVSAALIGMICLGPVLSALAQDHPTAADLLQQGITHLEEGRFNDAKQSLRRVDPLQLDRDQREQLRSALEEVVLQQAVIAEARAALAEADAAGEVGETAEAKQIYQAVAENPNVPVDLRDQALAGMATMEEAERASEGAEAEAEAAADAGVEAEPLAAAEQAAEAEDATIEDIEVEPVEAEPLEMETVEVETDEPDTATEAADSDVTSIDAMDEDEADDVEVVVVEETAGDVEAAEAEGEVDEDSSSSVLAQAVRLRAQKLVAEADESAKAGEYNSALKKYRSALALQPENERARRGLENVQALLGRDTGEGILPPVAQSWKLQNQRTKARYQQAMEEANRAVQAGNYPQAQDAVSWAKSVLDTNRQYLTQSEYNGLRQNALDLGAQIDQAAELERLQTLERQERRVESEQEQRRIKAERERQQKVQQLLRRARDLQKEMKYREALEVLDQLTFIDPQNVAAEAMRDMTRDAILYRNTREARKERRYAIAQHGVENFDASYPQTELVRYPADWPQLTQLRLGVPGGEVGGSEIDRRILEKLKQPIPVAFDNNQFENVIEYLRNITGVNFFVNWRALEGAGIDRDSLVSLQLDAVPADKALRLILDQLGGDLVPLGFTIDEGVVTISTQENLARKTIIRTYDIRDLVVAVPNFSESPQFDLNTINQQASSGGGGGGGSSIFDDVEEDDEGVLGRTELIDSIMNLIREQVDPDNWRNAGGLVSSMSELNGTLIVTTTPANHRDITGLLSQLRETRALQIAVEARFLLVDQSFMEEVGVDIDVTLNDLGDNFGPITIAQNSVNLASASATPTGLSFSFIDAGGGVASGQPQPASIDTAPSGRSFLFQASFLNDIQVDLLVKATQADSRSITLTAPRVTFFNGQRAYVTISRQIAFVSDLEPVVGTSSVAFNPDIGVVSDGVVLDVEGTISADRRYVTLTVRPSLAQIAAIREFAIFEAVDTDDDDDDDGGDDGLQFGVGVLQQPEIQLTTVRTTVSVPDKGTLLLGGQRLVGEIEIEAGVPVLSKIPILNRLFTNRSTVKDERTLLILVKPTIIIQSEEEEKLFPGLNQAPELFGAEMGQ